MEQLDSPRKFSSYFRDVHLGWGVPQGEGEFSCLLYTLLCWLNDCNHHYVFYSIFKSFTRIHNVKKKNRYIIWENIFTGGKKSPLPLCSHVPNTWTSWISQDTPLHPHCVLFPLPLVSAQDPGSTAGELANLD